MDNLELIFRRRAEELDREDVIKDYKDYFRENRDSLIYLDGNSLGMLPLKSELAVNSLIREDWGQRLIRGWNEGWWDMPVRVGRKLAELVGAGVDEVIACDSTSVNLYKLVVAALKMRPGRSKIISDEINFPSDLYIIQGVIENAGEGHSLVLARSEDGISILNKELIRLIDEDTALVVLSYVSFKSSFMFDMEEVTRMAHEKGALIIWDLSHASGAVRVDLSASGADMAIGCTYKYLNGGPGSPAFLYIRKDLQKETVSPVWGWFGEMNPFDFSLDYRNSQDIRHLLTGTPNILSMSTLEPALDIVIEAGIDRIRDKSMAMTDFMIQMYNDLLKPLNFRLGTPSNKSERGSHVSIQHPEAFRICKALIDPEEGEFEIIPDFRPPDNIRLGLAPLYNSFMEIWFTIIEIERIVSKRVYQNYDMSNESVT